MRILVCYSLLIGLPLPAQVSAGLSGAVTDPTGAVIPAATITVKNIDTGSTRAVVTDAAGRYQT